MYLTIDLLPLRKIRWNNVIRQILRLILISTDLRNPFTKWGT